MSEELSQQPSDNSNLNESNETPYYIDNEELAEDTRFFGRITVTQNVSIQYKSERPVSESYGFEREIDSEEQPYPRRLKVGEEWVQLAKGCWLEHVGHVTISNEEGKRRDRVPSLKEIEETAQKVIEVAYLEPAIQDYESFKPKTQWSAEVVKSAPLKYSVFSYVLPKETAQFTPANFANLFIRCRKGQAKVYLFCLPG